MTTEEEEANSADPLKKIRPFHEFVKRVSMEFYQPLREVSVDERMVKSKARTHFRQYIRNKPTKWGFKYWVLADPTGYTCNFDLYCGRHRIRPLSENGLSFDVVMELVQSYQHQGYAAFFDNFYTLPTLLHALKDKGISGTGTLRTNRRGIPESVVQLSKVMQHSDIPRGTGYYIREHSDMYMC